MSRVNLKGNRRLTARARGQSLPLIGMMVVILVGMVGLSVDVGNTFQTERRAVAASNAASLAGMNVYLRRNNSTTNQAVYNAIINTLNSNGVQVTAPGAEPQPGELQMRAVYLDAQGKLIDTGSPVISNNTNTVPTNVAFVQVSLEGLVDTYFARVVGRNDLPIDATAHAGTCPDGAGIYPIGVDKGLLDPNNPNRFDDPGDFDPIDGQPDYGWRVITSGEYAGYTAMRMNVQGNQASGGFSWLRWAEKTGATGTNAGSAVELEASLALPGGNALTLYEEAPWPDEDVPQDYPRDPGIPSGGDWVYGSSGYSQKVDDEMDAHVRVGTRMKLPILETGFVGQGNNSQYLISHFGVFVVLSHGQEKGTKYIELVYLGSNLRQESACSYTAAPTPGETYDLFGEIQIRPQYASVPKERRPVQYLIVLDVSGSMSANFDGQCDEGPGNYPSGRNYWQCANGPGGAPAVEVGGTGPTYYWRNQAERRITVAKDAIESLLRSTNMPANNPYDNTRPDDQMAVVWFTSSVDRDGTGNITSFGTSNFSNQVGDANGGLTRAIRRAGWRNSDPYRTEGGTNGAAGLYRAALAFDDAPDKVTDANGKTWEYKRVVIFITDGVSNQFLDTNDTDLHAGSSSANTYPSGHFCRTVANVVEVATCQVTGSGSTGGGLSTGGGGVPAGLNRPITQAGLVSKEDLQPKGALVYTIALSNIPDTGLKDTIASFPNYYFPANKLQIVDGQTNVEEIMDKINTEVENGLCAARTDVMDQKPEWRADIPPSHFQSIEGLVYPNVGEVTIKNVEDDTTFTIPIIADSSGKLSYRKENVPQGSYLLTAYLYYRHPLDPPTALPRQYSTILEADRSILSITVKVGPDTANTGSFKPVVQQDLKLLLTGDVCAK